MANERYVLSPVTVDDIPGMIEVYLSSFASDAFSAYTFPRDQISEEEMNRWLTRRFTRMLDRREMHTLKIIDTSTPTNTQVAFFRYSSPHELTTSEKAARETEKQERDEVIQRTGRDPTWPLGANVEICDGKFGGLDRMREKFVDEKEMYVAHLLCVSPSHQRLGLGSRLLKHVLDQADREIRKCYIEATSAGHPVYFKLGFRDVDVLKLDLKPWGGDFVAINRLMIRDPQPIV
ncbi:uncharacterized protein RSE6_11261 [Rhynchosporium secalis]|uniref:N-acetyltransferase domain-containing protein n=1 Tax=Rhynchosporium secalis TaxID=38038 RepID=A0A1E1MMJ1_RHYSE|nr:uncharacterized protein RSE6_11261 [Rhynchosporium secalis]